ncbi:hypothetical protein N9309_05265 [Acidimicrobiia bacterium]|nr:hypothetical protein [Acidimicrobiia bacterium]
MKTADMDNKVLGNLDYYTDKKVYSTDQFKSDYKDFVKHRKLIIQKRQNKETKTVTWKSKDQSKLKLSKQGHDNFQALCIISASRWFNANIPLIKNKDTLSNILTYSEDNNSVDFRLSYSVKNKNYYATADHMSFAMAVLDNMERLSQQVALTQKVSAWVNWIFSYECKVFIKKPLSSQALFHDGLLKRVKKIIRQDYTKTPKLETFIKSQKIKFVEIKDGIDPIGFALVSKSGKKTNNINTIEKVDEAHLFNILEINHILANYKIKKLPSAAASTAENVEDQIHASRRGMIFDNATLLNIMMECCSKLGEVSYAALYTSLGQKLSNIQVLESASLSDLELESQMQKNEKEINDEILLEPIQIKNTTSEDNLLHSTLDEFDEDEGVFTSIENTSEDRPENLVDYNEALEGNQNAKEESSDTKSSESEKYYNLNLSDQLYNYLLKSSVKELKSVLEQIDTEHPGLYEDLELFVVASTDIYNKKNSQDPRKVSQSYLDELNKEEFFQYERGKEYFQRLRNKMINENKIEEEDSNISLLVTLFEIYKGKT